MKTLTDYKRQWAESPALQADWLQITRTPAWALVSAMVAAEFISVAAPESASEHDAVLSRRLMRQVGALKAIERLQKAADEPSAAPWEPPDPWEHISPDTNTNKQT